MFFDLNLFDFPKYKPTPYKSPRPKQAERLLARVAEEFCNNSCPTTWTTGEPRPHCATCQELQAFLKGGES